MSVNLFFIGFVFFEYFVYLVLVILFVIGIYDCGIGFGVDYICLIWDGNIVNCN